MNLFPIRHQDLASALGLSKVKITRIIKDAIPEEFLFKSSGRVHGIAGTGVELVLKPSRPQFYKGGLYIVSTQVGGSGKTTSVISLATGYRRISCSKKHPIVIVDSDPQGSSTKLLFGSRANKKDPVLVHYVEGKASLEECLWELDDNIWVIKSNLENLYLNKEMEKKAIKVKEGMFNLCLDIFQTLGPQTKIFVDTPPALAASTNSFYIAAKRLRETGEVDSKILIPVRPDDFSVDGAGTCVSEAKDALAAYTDSSEGIEMICFMLKIDGRVKDSALETIKLLLENEHTKDIICSKYVGYSNDATKAQLNNTSIFSRDTFKRIPKIAQDYQDLLLEILEEGNPAKLEDGNG